MSLASAVCIKNKVRTSTLAGPSFATNRFAKSLGFSQPLWLMSKEFAQSVPQRAFSVIVVDSHSNRIIDILVHENKKQTKPHAAADVGRTGPKANDSRMESGKVLQPMHLASMKLKTQTGMNKWQNGLGVSRTILLNPNQIGNSSSLIFHGDKRSFFGRENFPLPWNGPAVILSNRGNHQGNYFPHRQMAMWGNQRKDYKHFKDNLSLEESVKAYPAWWAAVILIPLVLAIIFYFTNQDTVPISGRNRLILVSKGTELALSEQAYKMLLEQYKGKLLPQNHRHVQALKRVGLKIIKASGIPELQDLNWEFNVIDSNEANAMVLPGGKVIVFTGILPIMSNEDGMAAVLGHEIGHIVARHSAEQMEKQRILLALHTILGSVFHTSYFLRNIMLMTLSLKFSRANETEADHIGACYDPKHAVGVWQRFLEKEGKAPKMIGFLSTHPPTTSRLERIKEWVPEGTREAMKNECTERAHVKKMIRQINAEQNKKEQPIVMDKYYEPKKPAETPNIEDDEDDYGDTEMYYDDDEED